MVEETIHGLLLHWEREEEIKSSTAIRALEKLDAAISTGALASQVREKSKRHFRGFEELGMDSG